MTPAQIATERRLTLGTVFGHLTRFVDSRQVQLADLISADHQRAIERVIRMVGTDQGTTPIKALCPADVTYDEIRLMLTYAQRKD
jgi:hypothetical protein